MCVLLFFFFLMIRRPPRSTQSRSSAASDVYKRQLEDVARRRSSPAVDRLEWVADRGDREAAAEFGVRPREEALQQVRLGERRVLILSLIHISEPTRPY